MTKHLYEALNEKMFGQPLAYTVQENGTWHYIHDVHAIKHAHSLLFTDGETWDERNGWRTQYYL